MGEHMDWFAGKYVDDKSGLLASRESTGSARPETKRHPYLSRRYCRRIEGLSGTNEDQLTEKPPGDEESWKKQVQKSDDELSHSSESQQPKDRPRPPTPPVKGKG
jgi:hypothetical protein